VGGKVEELWRKGFVEKISFESGVEENSGYAEDGLVEYLVGCSRVSCSSQAWSARWRWQWYWQFCD